MLSIDPVVTDANTGGSFNRYAYANNNPYKYIDPDGRDATGQLTVWPVPGQHKLNSKDKPGEGDGRFGSPRANGRTHNGIDIQAPDGARVVATGDGKIVDIKPNPSASYGKQVVIDHGKGIFTQSAHLESTTVKPGETVTAGQTIGAVGRTGNTPALGDTHLHFEVREGNAAPTTGGGKVVDPLSKLPPPESKIQ